MSPDLLSAPVSMLFAAIAGAALVALLAIARARRHPALYLTDAAAAAGLLDLFSASAFGLTLAPRELLFALYAAVFSGVSALTLSRMARDAAIGFPVRTILIRQGAMAYIFAPVGFWRPLLSLLLMGYFLFEAMGWLRGSEAPIPQTGEKDFRPPLFPPRRIRGPREFALAGLSAAFVYVFAMGVNRLPDAPPPEPPRQEEAAVSEEPATAAPVEVARAPEAGQTYTAVAGETLKSIAKKLYGDPAKWRALAAANPGLRAKAKLKAGQTVNLPEPPTINR
jgi:phage tail protein X